MDNQLLTVKDVMKKLQISRPLLHKLTKERTIKSVKIGSAVRYEDSAIQEFIKSQIQQPVGQD